MKRPVSTAITAEDDLQSRRKVCSQQLAERCFTMVPLPLVMSPAWRAPLTVLAQSLLLPYSWLLGSTVDTCPSSVPEGVVDDFKFFYVNLDLGF